ncbi:MAG TPA: hypothetical protein VG841_02040 [Caulobacterales bacterium]|nr:hypothetical protein [Caulobacterales bacterium]
MLGVWSAFLFNICLALLPMASAFAIVAVQRDNLYTYESTPSLAQDVRARIERIAGGLIPLDFDRRRQWDDMVAIELVKGDVSAARGFVLSARAMLPSRDADQLNRALHSGASDADIELAALDFLTPGTRARYESAVPLLSRRSASGLATTRAAERPAPLGDARDFELLAGAMMGDADSDPLHFTLTGLGLGLGGALTPRMQAGASALIAAGRDPNFGGQFAQEITDLVASAAPADKFRAEALSRVRGGADPAAFPVASAAFRAAVDAHGLNAVKALLDQIGRMSEASSPSGAALLLTHARSMRDLPRLLLIAEAGGDRATAVAKNAPHDGRLPGAAHGVLKFSGDLISMLGVIALAVIGLMFAASATSVEAFRRAWRNVHADMYATTRRGRNDELVQNFDVPWRTL